jgi:hypothetical protein
MLMRFHFGLGVGHVYSHYRATEVGLLQREDIALHTSSNHDVDESANDAEVSDDDHDDSDDESDGSDSGLDIVGSNESLLDQFDEMYDREVDLDYEN